MSRREESNNARRALVVGSGRGIGLAIVRQLLATANVDRVYASARRPEQSEALSALASANPERCETLAIDVTAEASIAAAAAAIGERSDRLDLIVNCAGLLHDGNGLGPERKLSDVDPGNLDRLFQVHGAGPLLLAKNFQTLLPRRERFVFASLSARVGSIGDNRLGGWYGYRITKAAHNMAIKTMSIELARRSRQGICVALHPGTVDTDLSRPFSQRVPAEKLFTPERAARQLLDVIDAIGPEDNGSFIAWDGSKIPW